MTERALRLADALDTFGAAGSELRRLHIELTMLRGAAKDALSDIRGAKLCEANSMSNRAEMLRLMSSAANILRAALDEK